MRDEKCEDEEKLHPQNSSGDAGAEPRVRPRDDVRGNGWNDGRRRATADGITTSPKGDSLTISTVSIQRREREPRMRARVKCG